MIPKYRLNEHIIHFKRVDDDDYVTGYYIWHFGRIRKFLRNFGHLITKLDFPSTCFTLDEIKLLNIDIAEYCSISLEKVALSGVGSHLISETNHTFNNVVSVDVRYHHFDDNLELDRIYPKMERLKITSRYPFTFSSIQHTYPHLKHLEINNWGTLAESVILKSLLQLNRQLESLQIDGFPEIYVLEYASEQLTNLVSLSLGCYAYRFRDSEGFAIHSNATQNIHFRNVRKFTLGVGWEALQSIDQIPITFEQLEILEISWPTSFEKIVPLITPHNRLKILSIPLTDTKQSYSNVLTVVNALAELEEIRLQWSSRISVVETLRIMHDFQHLKMITFVVSTGGEYDDLMDLIPNEWQFYEKFYNEIVEMYYLTFERKRNDTNAL